MGVLVQGQDLDAELPHGLQQHATTPQYRQYRVIVTVTATATQMARGDSRRILNFTFLVKLNHDNTTQRQHAMLWRVLGYYQ